MARPRPNSRQRRISTVPLPNTYHAIRVLARLWGLLWGLSFKFLVVWREKVSNREQNGLGGRAKQLAGKLAALSNIAQGVGTPSNDLSTFVLMELRIC